MISKKQSRRTGVRAAREQEMRRLVRDQERSGLSQRKFCDVHGVPLSTLTWWRKKLGQGGGCKGHQAGEFFEVKLVDDTLATETELPTVSPIEIRLPGGAVIRIPHGVPEATLRGVISMVAVPC